ncbi:hypothetical protein NESM_000118100 [Novymonas esmeraldas]|uniref:Uncharacterized protein n=1 Tax=Novymonas esmeraldas TaxID=1808958 RepID=A0AAW0F381_9TRYP
MLRVSRVGRVASAVRGGPPPPAPASSSISLIDSVTAALRTSRYLRHAPPRLYVTCTHELGTPAQGCGRHMTKVLDVSREASPTAPPHTQSVYLLTSTTMSDVQFTVTEAQSQVLVGLPLVHSADAALRFCDAHAATLSRVHHVVLPGAVSPLQSVLVRHLLDRVPQARLVCNTFGREVFTNATFHDGVRRAVLENAPGTPLDLLRFAELPADRVSAVVDGDAVAVDLAAEPAEGATPSRMLRVVAVRSTSQEQRRKEQHHTHRPAHFTNGPLFFYDEVFSALFVGHTLHRVPWLPTVLAEAPRALVLPVPPPLAAQHPRSRPNALLDTWRVVESCDDVVDTLRRTPALERVLSSSYGELSGNVEECVAALESSSDALEGLRSRLARRLATDSSRDVHRWSTALLKRIVQEVASTQKASTPTSPDTLEAFLAWARDDDTWGHLATCLTHAAMVLPPTLEADAPPTDAAAADIDGHTPSPVASAAPSTDAGQVAEAALGGAAGVELLVAVLERKGLQGLTRMAQRETIDVQVFLTMSEDDLRRVFKSTFGITKRLTLLQEELRKTV